MGRKVKEEFNVIGETRALDETARRTKAGIIYAYSLINFEPGVTDGELVRSKGFIKKLNLSNQPIKNINFTKNSTGEYKCTVITNGCILDVKDLATTPTYSTKYTSLPKDVYISLIEANNKLVVLDGDYPKLYDFASVTNLTTAFKSNVGAYINDRLWLNKIDEPALVQWSKAGDISDFITSGNAGFLQIEDNNKPITALTSLNVPGNNQTNIIIAKENETHSVSGSNGISTDANRFKQSNLSRSIGTPSPRGLVQVGQEVFIMGKNDIIPYSTLESYNGQIKSQDIFVTERPLYKEILNYSYLKDAFLFYAESDGRDGRVYAFTPTNGLDWNDTAFVYDRKGGWFRRKWYNHNFTCMSLNPENNKIYAGDAFGNVYEMFNGYNYNGQGYNSFIDFGLVDFGVQQYIKTGTSGSFIEVETSPESTFKLGMIKRDRNGVIGKLNNIDYTVTQAQYLYNNANYNQAVYNANFSQKIELKTGIFNELGLQLSIYSPDINLKIKKLYLSAEASNI